MIFKPNGTLDLATAATDIQEQDMTRCKNLRVETSGKVELRRGSRRITTTRLSGQYLAVMDGNRIAGVGKAIYWNETLAINGMQGPDWDGCRYKSYNQTTRDFFMTNGTDRIRIDASGNAYQWGIEPPTTAPTLAAGASTGLTGTYNVKYTYVRKSGTTVISESNPSPAGTAVDLNDESLSITWTASSDSQVTHVRIYRTLADGEIYYYSDEVAIGSVTLDDDNADSALSTLVETDHDRPPTGGECVAGPLFNGYVFMSVGSNLWWSDPQQPEYWPTTNYVECAGPDEPITALCEFDGRLYAFSKYGCWHIQGTGTGTFLPIRLPVSAGAANKQSVVPVVGRGIYHTGQDGIYQIAGGVDKGVTDSRFLPIFDGKETNGVPAVTNITASWMVQFHNKIFFHYLTGYCLVLNIDNNRASYYEYDGRLFPGVVDEKNDRLLAYDVSGHVRRLEDPSATEDSGTDINWEVQSKDFTMQTRAHFPRLAKYDIESSGTNVKAEIILDGVSHQTHWIVNGTTQVASYDRNPRRRLIVEGNGERCAIRISGTGRTTIYAAEME